MNFIPSASSLRRAALLTVCTGLALSPLHALEEAASHPAPAPASTPNATPAPEAPQPPPLLATATPPAPSPAATPTPAEAPENAEFQKVRVQVSGPPESQNVTEALRLQVKVRNRTGEEIVIRKVRWELPYAVLATRAAAAEPASAPWLEGATVGLPATLSSGAEQLYDLALPASEEPWWKLPLNLKLMGFKPHDYAIKVAVEYEAGPQKRRSIEEETLPVKFDTTPWFYLWGGIAGSLVGVLFEFFYSIVRGLESYRWPKSEKGRLSIGRVLLDLITYLLQWLIGGTIKFLTGALTAALVLLVLYYYKDVRLPITIQINDFLGAAAIGLFTHRLGLWAYDALFSHPSKAVPAGPKSPSAGLTAFSVEQLPPSLSYTDEK